MFFFFFITKHLSYNIVNCSHWDLNAGPLPSLYLAYLNIECFSTKVRHDGLLISKVKKLGRVRYNLIIRTPPIYEEARDQINLGRTALVFGLDG